MRARRRHLTRLALPFSSSSVDAYGLAEAHAAPARTPTRELPSCLTNDGGKNGGGEDRAHLHACPLATGTYDRRHRRCCLTVCLARRRRTRDRRREGGNHVPSPPDFAASPLRHNREGREGGSRLAVPSDFAATSPLLTEKEGKARAATPLPRECVRACREGPRA